MFRNYLKTAWRNIRRHKAYAGINIFGLAVGLGCAVVIILFVIHELSYDTHHPDSDRLYRVNLHRVSPTGDYHMARTPGPLSTILKQEMPQVEQAFRMVPPYENSDNVLTVNGKKRFFETKIYFVDPEILREFNIPFAEGNSLNALERPNTVLITKDMARKYFGDVNPIGRTLQMEFDYDLGASRVRLEDFTVTGVLRNAPSNTHIRYHMLVSMATLKQNLPKFEADWANPKAKYTYVKLAAGTDPKVFEQQIQIYAEKLMRIFKERYGRYLGEASLNLQPVTRIHMHPQPYGEPQTGGNWLYIYVYALIAGLVLLIGCMNFINLSTALSTTRAREVGLRKVAGAARSQLIRQYLVEAQIITLISFIFALGVALILLPQFNRMAGTTLTLSQLADPVVLISLLVLFMLVSFISGIFPALILTGLKPASIFQERFKFRLRGTLMQKILVAGQFAVTVFLVICTLSVLRQLDFMKGQALGFEKEQKLILRVKSNLGHLRRDYEAIKDAFLQHPGVTGAAVSSSVPGDESRSGYMLWREGKDRRSGVRLKVITTGADFIPLYGIQVVAGREFRKGQGPDITGAYMVNETGARALGFSSLQEALAQRFTGHYHGQTKEIIGVVKDFHFRGMQEKIEPLLLDIESSLFDTLTLQVNVRQMKAVMAHVGSVWQQHFPDVPMEFSFLDDNFERVYRYEEQMGQMLRVIALLGILIACLGLSGLAAFISWKRQKEIGIRRVLGASVTEVVTVLSVKFLNMVLVSILVAFPLAYLALEKWLASFAYRAPLGVWIFILSAVGALILAFGSVAFQGVRAARRNPVDTLRTE